MKILVIDSWESARLVIKETLKDNWHYVVTAPNAIEGLEILKKTPDFDLVIIDLMSGGISAIKEIKSFNRVTKVILTSIDKEDKEVAQLAGADEFFYKDILTDVNSVIQNLFPALLPG